MFTILPHFVLRYRQMRPAVVRDALLAMHGGLSLELCAVICHISPMALYRLVCAFGHQSLVTVLTRCGLPLPTYFLADEKHSYCLTEKVYLSTIVSGRVIWHLGYTENASATAFTQSYGEFQRAASRQEPTYRVRGILTDGFDSTTRSIQMPVTSRLLDQAHNTIERKLFAMKGFRHPGGSQQACLTGLAHLYNLIPYQRRAQHAGQSEVEVEGGRVPTRDWFLNLQILTSGGFR